MPKTNIITALIEKTPALIEEPRDYVGASSIGDACERKIWYALKGFKGIEPSKKIRITWDIGKCLERLIVDLIKQTIIPIETPSAANLFLQMVDREQPYFKGHCDAIIYDNIILEIKTAKDSSFKLLQKNGVERWNANYYAQLQSYMGMSGFEHGVLIALNKDSSELYDEWVDFDPLFYEGLRYKAKKIYESESEPPRVNNSPLWYACKMCQFREICHL